MPHSSPRPEPFVARHAEARLRTALTDTRIVAVVGPRQSGKTTLARQVAASEGRPFITLDDEQFRHFAESDPAGFVRGQRSAAIDEVQRAPGLILALKQSVDEDPRPGRYLITGSVDLFKSMVSPDSLAGRVETIELLPFSRAEISGSGMPEFLDRAFAAAFPSLAVTGRSADLIEHVVAGGYPEALSRTAPARRRSWLRAYVRSLAERDVSSIAKVGKRDEMSRLIDHAALQAGQLLNLTRLGTQLGVDGKTAERWLVLLEHMFLIRRIRAWHRNDLKRLVKTPKLQFLDSGLLAALRGTNAGSLETDRRGLGPLLECFVHAELAKAATISSEAPIFSHYRDKDQVEVDLVLESAAGDIVGIEVKASATLRPRDFRGLERLQKATGERFACGIVLHDGERVQQVAARLFAMPVDMLWNSHRLG